MSTVEPLNVEELAALRAEHAVEHWTVGLAYCAPCRLLATLDAERATRQVSAPEPLREAVAWAVTALDDVADMAETGGDIPTEVTIIQNRLRAAAQGPEQARDTGGLREALEWLSTDMEYAAKRGTEDGDLDRWRLAVANIRDLLRVTQEYPGTDGRLDGRYRQGHRAGWDAALSQGAAHEEHHVHDTEACFACAEVSEAGRAIGAEFDAGAAHEERGLNVERLGFTDLLDIGEALLAHYPPDTIVCSHSVKADIGAQTAAGIADVIASCRARLATPEAAPEEGTGIPPLPPPNRSLIGGMERGKGTPENEAWHRERDG